MLVYFVKVHCSMWSMAQATLVLEGYVRGSNISMWCVDEHTIYGQKYISTCHSKKRVGQSHM